MEINEKRITEIFLAIILVLLLIVIIFLFTNSSITGKSTSTISDSYNTYYINQNPQTQQYRSYDSIYYSEENLNEKRYLQFSSRSDFIRQDRLFGNYIDKYTVYVRNKEYQGGYFTVKFYFEDYYGEKTTQSITHYIKPHEEKEFYYKNLYANKYYKTYYEVVPRTKVPSRYYKEDSRIKYIG